MSGQCLNTAFTSFDGVSCTDCGTLPTNPALLQDQCLRGVSRAGTSCTFEECASPALSVPLASGQCLEMADFDGVSCTDCDTLAARQDQCLSGLEKAGTSCTPTPGVVLVNMMQDGTSPYHGQSNPTVMVVWSGGRHPKPSADCTVELCKLMLFCWHRLRVEAEASSSDRL